MKETSYFERLCSILDTNLESIQNQVPQLADMITQTWKNGGTVFVMGNGGSDSSAQHFVIDCLSIRHTINIPINAEALSSNTSVITAIANDLGYEHVFSKQLERKLKSVDLCIFLSASGNSPNLLKACEFARNSSVKTVGILGFDGGSLGKQVDFVIQVETEIGQYGICEDVHLSILHATVEIIRELANSD